MKTVIEINALVSDESAVAEATVVRGAGMGDTPPISNGTGWSKKHPHDTPDKVVGYNLAMARVLRDLADQYETVAFADNTWAGKLTRWVVSPFTTTNTFPTV